jgi:putative DNA primase/helicase
MTAAPAQANIYPHLIPGEMKQYDQWVCWKYEWQDRKWKKRPIRAIDNGYTSVTNPLDCTDFDTANKAAQRYGLGIGFVLTGGDPFCGIDLDDPGDNQILIQRNQAILKTMNSYVEASPSGKGVHVIVRAKLPGRGHRRDKVEVYSTARFFTMTGSVLWNLPIADRQTETVELWQSLGGTDRAQSSPIVENRPEHTADARIVEMAGKAKYGARF